MCSYNISKKLFGYYIVVLIISFSFLSSHVVAKQDNNKIHGYSNLYGVVTPSQVYALLENYNVALLHYVKTHKRSLLGKVKAEKLVVFKNKKPEDVFVILNKLSSKVDKLTRRVKQKPMTRVKREKAKAIPAEVFLQAGNNLDAFVQYMHSIEVDKSWGQFYTNRTYSVGKTPDNVYALVDLLLRKTNYILS